MVVGVFKTQLEGIVVYIATESLVLTLGMDRASNCKAAIVPVASCIKV